MMLFNLGSLASNGLRVRATMEVMEGWERQRFSTPLPIKPVEPVRMTFMVLRLF